MELVQQRPNVNLGYNVYTYTHTRTYICIYIAKDIGPLKHCCFMWACVPWVCIRYIYHYSIRCAKIDSKRVCTYICLLLLSACVIRENRMNVRSFLFYIFILLALLLEDTSTRNFVLCTKILRVVHTLKNEWTFFFSRMAPAM